MILSNKALRYFKLSKDPFSAEMSSHKDVYLPNSTSVSELKVWKAIHNNLIAALVGDVGSGKSTLMEKILDEMKRNKLFRMVRTQMLSRRRMTISHINDELLLGLLGQRTWNIGQVDKSHKVAEALDDCHSRGQKVLMVIDEAHDLPSQTLREIKALHELRGKFVNPLSVVLVGQKRLHRRLQKEVDLKEVLDRTEVVEMIGYRHPRTGSMEEAIKYLKWKLEKAGVQDLGDIFTDDGLEMMMEHPAARYPLGLNNLMSHAIMLAAEYDEKRVDARVVANAFTSVDYDGETVDREDDAPAGKEVAA